MSFGMYMGRYHKGSFVSVDREKVWGVMQKHYWSQDAYGIYYLGLSPDGEAIEFSASGLDGNGDFMGIFITLWNLSDETLRVVFELARSTDMIIYQGDDQPLIATSQFDPSEFVPEGATPVREVVFCPTPEELGKALSESFDEYCDYREQIQGCSSNE